MTRLMTMRHHGPLQTRGVCDGEATTVATASATQIFVRCAPLASGASKNLCRVQSRVIYDSLAQLLAEAGASLDDVVFERAFFRHLAADLDDFQGVRREAYRKRGVCGEELPAVTCVEQPPCCAGQDIELQAYAVVAAEDGRVRIHAGAPGRDRAVAKIVEIGQARFLYLANVAGHDGNGSPPESFRRQSDLMFHTAAEVLRSHGASFGQVLRTWVFLDDIDRDYAEFNESRSAFFAREGITRLPAGTPIGGGSHPRENRCTLDLWALLNPEIAHIEVMRAAALNDAFGPATSLGLKVALPEQTYLFVSGTAGVDEQGATAPPGDVPEQIERMLLSVEELLRAHGAGFSDLVQASTFLRSAEYLDAFRQIADRRGLSRVPNTIVETQACRRDLFCEMEAVAVLPPE